MRVFDIEVTAARDHLDLSSNVALQLTIGFRKLASLAII